MVEMKRIVVYAVILTALALLVGVYMGMIYAQDQHRVEYVSNNTTVYRVIHSTIDGDPTIHEMVFEVMVVSDGVDEEQVNRALLMCPNVFGYTIIENDPGRYYFTVDEGFWAGYGGIPFPNEDEDYLMLVVDREEYPECQVAGVTVEFTDYYLPEVDPYGTITVVWDENWSDMTLTNVIYHECAHSIETAPVLDSPEMGEFDQWLQDQQIGSYPSLTERGWIGLRNNWVVNEYLCSVSG